MKARLLSLFLLLCGLSLVAAEPADADKIAKILKGQPGTWVFTGDSITHSAQHTKGWRGFPEIFSERLRWEMRRTQDMVINSAISGNKIADINAGYDWRVKRFQPSVVVLMIGMNDCGAGEAKADLFAQDLSALVKRFHTDGAAVVLLTSNPIDPARAGARKAVYTYNEKLRAVAAAEGCVLVDNEKRWKEEAPEAKAQLGYLNDAIHPNQIGHRLIAQEIFKVLKIYDAKSPSCEVALPKK
jgi:acyl-CoA thioesterase I